MSSLATKAASLVRYRFGTRLVATVKSLTHTMSNVTTKAGAAQLQQGSRSVIKLVLGGSFFVISMLLALLLISALLLENDVLGRTLPCFVALLYLGIVELYVRRGRFVVAAWMLIALYVLLGSMVLILWTVNAPIGILILSFVIILTAVTLGARFIIPVTAGVIAVLVSLQVATLYGVIHPNLTALVATSSFGDVAGYAVIFTVFALVSWMAGKQTEQSLQQALTAEAALEKEKQSLALRLEEKTRSLRNSQLEEMRQLYRFAELGQLSAAVLHELANHLTVLTLDIDDIQQRHHRAEAVDRVKESIGYLDTMVSQARLQLQESDNTKEFNVLSSLSETVTGLMAKAANSGVDLTLSLPSGRRSFKVLGDPLRFSQIMTIIITNAIEASANVDYPAITVEAKRHHGYLTLTVSDHGIGIPAAQQSKLFQPFQSKKKNGLGMGLFIAKKMVETHFKGTIAFDSSRETTTFVVKLPEYNQKPRV